MKDGRLHFGFRPFTFHVLHILAIVEIKRLTGGRFHVNRTLFKI
jgi:hypothetical protein